MNEYWKKRNSELLKIHAQKADDIERELIKEYERSLNGIKKEIETFYARYAGENGISMAEARKQLSRDELKGFKLSLEEFREKALDNADGKWTTMLDNEYMRSRVSRLEALKYQMRGEVELLKQKQEDKFSTSLKKAYSDTYYTTNKHIADSVDYAVNFAKFDRDTVKNAIYEKWLDGRMNVSKSRSAALYQTEYTHIMVDARLRSIMDAGCDEYEIDENMDSDICDECASMHGKHFKLSEYQQGITAPPFHTRCRGTITGYFVEEEETLENVEDTDTMSLSKVFDEDGVRCKCNPVKNHNGIYTQTNSKNAQNTIKFVIDTKNSIDLLGDVSEIVIAKSIKGIAAYSHKNNRLYINEKLTDESFLNEMLKDGYFVAENKLDVLWHEMFHKKHWDFVLTNGGESNKMNIESELRKYVKEQQRLDYSYVSNTVSRNAKDGLKREGNRQLNELIAEVLLQEKKGIVKDKRLLELVKRCVK